MTSKPSEKTPAPAEKAKDKAKHRIFLVDDHPMMRLGLRDLFEGEPGCEVCGEAATAKEALDAIRREKPDLVMMDLALPDGSGLELLKELRAADDEPRVLFFSMHDELLYAERVVKAGGRGYLLKGAPPEQIMQAVERVMAGGIYLSNDAARHILGSLAMDQGKGIRTPLELLSDRELEIFNLLGHGAGNPEIAGQLKISPRTVDAHRTNIKVKLGLRNSADVLRRAVLWVELDQGARRSVEKEEESE